MKQILAILLAILLLGTVTACNRGTDIPFGGTVDLDTATFIDFKSQYIRTGSRTDTKYPIVSIVRSAEELDAYYQINRDRFDLQRRENPAADSTIGFLDACDEYDADFFKNNALVLIVIEEGSGSTRHNVDYVMVDAKGSFYVNICPIVARIGTCDMAQWHIIVAAEKDKVPASADDVLVYYDGELKIDKANHVDTEIGTENGINLF